MKTLRQYIAEAENPQRKTKTKTKPQADLGRMFEPQQDQPLIPQSEPAKPEPKINKVGQKRTLQKTQGINPTGQMRNMLGKMKNIELDTDLPAYPDPDEPETLPSTQVNNKNLPAIAGQALMAAGVQSPEFHQVANLPGNMLSMIRQLGRSLFSSFTKTPVSEIYVVANLGGQGPNTNREVQAVAGWLKKHGSDLGSGTVDFSKVMPGYDADIHQFSAAGARWMLVKDFGGQYIYSWPETDSLGAGNKKRLSR